MQTRTERAMAQWPNVPALFGWLGLNRHGDWLIQGQPVSNANICDAIAQNYHADAQGRWYFQNGPQRGYVALARAPLVLRVAADGSLHSHTGQPVPTLITAYLDEDGGLWFSTPLGPAALDDRDGLWALAQLQQHNPGLDDAALAAALALPPGHCTPLCWGALPLWRIDSGLAASTLGFQPQPSPLPGERHSH